MTEHEIPPFLAAEVYFPSPQLTCQMVWDQVEALSIPRTKFDPMKMDIPFARKVLEFAKEEHEDFTFNMHYWYEDTKNVDLPFKGANTCGTTACLAGTAVHLSPEAKILSKEDSWGSVEIDGEAYGWTQAGAKLMGLDLTTAQYLFVSTTQESTDPNTHALQVLEKLLDQAEKAQYEGKIE